MEYNHPPQRRFRRRLIAGALAATLSSGSFSFANPMGAGLPGPAGIASKFFPALPPGHLSLRFGPDQYAIWRGRYFLHGPQGFRVASPPPGAVILDLPVGFETVMIAGITYFLLAGTYYQRSGSGYVVVEPPVPPQPAIANDGRFLTVDAELLNVRSGPGSDNGVISQIRGGFQYRIEGSSPGWYYIRLSSDRCGWVMSQYTHIIKPDAKG